MYRKLLPLLALLLFLSGAAFAENAQAVLETLMGDDWAGYELAVVTSAAGSAVSLDDEPGATFALTATDACAFAVMRQGEQNLLVALEKEDDNWRVTDLCEGTLLQDVWIPCLRMLDTQHLCIEYLVPEGFDAFTLIYVRDDPEWKLETFIIAAWDRDVQISVQDSRLEYYDSLTGKRTTVRGAVRRSLSQIYLTSFPRTVEQARHKLSSPSLLPAFVGYRTIPEPIDFRFSAAEKYPVFAGPGENYAREADGKALLSSSDWVQIFGREREHDREWLLVQYPVSGGQMRFGWICTGLTDGTEPLWLNTRWLWSVGELRSQTELTDDPLHSHSAVVTLPSEQRVTVLAYLGPAWAYVQAEADGKNYRGFVLSDHLHEQSVPALSEAEARALALEHLKTAYPDFQTNAIMESRSVYYQADSLTCARWQFDFYLTDQRKLYDISVSAQSGAVISASGPEDPGNG